MSARDSTTAMCQSDVYVIYPAPLNTQNAKRSRFSIHAPNCPNNKKEPDRKIWFSGFRRRPTLPGRCQPSTIGAEGLNFCVRYGNRWFPFAIATGISGMYFLSHTLKTAHPNFLHLASTINQSLVSFTLLASFQVPWIKSSTD